MTDENKNDVQVGDMMPDGTIFAGISPDTRRPMYAAPANASLCMHFNMAVQYAADLAVGGKKDFRLPSKAELNVLFQNREKGALKGTFATAKSLITDFNDYYWSSTPAGDNSAHAGQRFTDGALQSFGGQGRAGRIGAYTASNALSVRCVRG